MSSRSDVFIEYIWYYIIILLVLSGVKYDVYKCEIYDKYVWGHVWTGGNFKPVRFCNGS